MVLTNDSGFGPYINAEEGNPLSETTDRFDIGDVDRDGADDLVSQILFVNQDAPQYEYTIEVFTADADFNLYEGGDTQLVIESDPRKNYGFALGNLDGNILSYPKPNDPDVEYDKAEYDNWKIYDFEPMPIDVSGNLVFSLFDQSSNALSESSEISQSLSTSVGVSGFGLGATFKSEYNESEIEVFGQTLSEAQTFSLSAANVIGGTNIWDYTINASLYWTVDKVAKLGMSVDLSQAGFKWNELYGQEVDPALNLPYKYEGVLNTDFIVENLDKTKSIRFDKINPNPEDTITAFIKVFNYSLLPMSEILLFSLYTGHPDQGGNLIEDLEGNSLFYPASILENQGRKTVEISFIVTNEMIGNADNRIYIQLDPNDDITEIHEDNNIGWTNLGYVCNTPEGLVSIDEFVLDDEAIRFNVFPNPASRMVTIDYSSSLDYLNDNLNIKIFDISGKLVAEQPFRSNHYPTIPSLGFYQTFPGIFE